MSLPDDAVHVWRASLDVSPHHANVLRRVLASDEHQRADRFRFERDRNHFIVARAVLRLLLGQYFDVPPHEIGFHYNQYGKPSVADPDTGAALCFNVSHSAGIALYAFAMQREVGIDIEAIRTDLPYHEIAQSVFSAHERVALSRLDANARPRGFFDCWTRKEAYIKARGMGLSLPLDEFDVSLAPGEAAMLLATRGEPNAVHQWSFKNIEAGPGFAGALAAEGQNWSVSTWQVKDTWLGDGA